MVLPAIRHDLSITQENHMGKALKVIGVLVLIVLIAFGQYVGVRNTLVAKNEAVKSAWSQVDIVLQRRADLIPNLVETVKGYAKQEQTVFGDIAKARSTPSVSRKSFGKNCRQPAIRRCAGAASGSGRELPSASFQ